ncbi:hypothetical protein [Algoriphagus aquimarinus]|uniref:Glycosyltransferase RgtA/B/C/D-like domain-containing protein n=1 Tax=Algoriphagus aquimarinus TaxID=237018 RepID=A0A5C7AM30_9BACT|nr:hypothetical protein [Algoriphagus aquimarinus]TXE08809.1 hypothetical protein ESV85_14705 [Algoriphagus aquimarinus]
MEKIKSSPFISFWSFLGLGAMIIIWFLPWRFQVNDDEIMMWLVSGAYTGTPESYAVFIHPILSWIFSKLYTFVPIVPWYPLTWFLVMYLAYVVFLIQITLKCSTFWTKLSWALFLFGLFIHFLFFLQFSIVAAFAIAAGLSKRFELGRTNSANWYKIYPSDLLILAGLLIRQEVPMLIFIGMLGLNVLVFRENRIYRALLIPIIFLAFSYSLTVLSTDHEFRKLNQLRSSVFDHPVLQLNKEDFKESHPELYHYSNGLIDFEEVPDLAFKLREWKVFLNSERTRQYTLPSIYTSLHTYIEHETFLVSIMVFFIAFTLFGKSKKQLIVLILLAAVLVLLSPFYLIKVQIYAILFLLYFLISLDKSPEGSLPVYLSRSIGTLLVLGICFHFFSYTKSSENFPSSQKLKNQLKNLKAEGIDEVVLIAAGEVYHELVFDNPLPFQVLGWPTLLVRSSQLDSLSSRAYLVDSATYANNASYFKGMINQPSTCDQVLLISNE